MPDDEPLCCSLGEKNDLQELVSDAYLLKVETANAHIATGAVAQAAHVAWEHAEFLLASCIANPCAPMAVGAPCSEKPFTSPAHLAVAKGLMNAAREKWAKLRGSL